MQLAVQCHEHRPQPAPGVRPEDAEPLAVGCDGADRERRGAVGVVIGFDDDDEAVRLANDSEFGLGGGVWASDPVRAYEIAKRIRAGMIYINGGGAGSSPHTAFGGYKQSGLGLERGEYGLDEFLLSKSIIWSAR